MGYGTPLGYGEGGYGTELPQPILSLVQGCTPLLEDPFGVFWALSVDDDGELTITSTTVKPIRQSPPTLSVGNSAWALSVDATESIQVTQVPTPGFALLPYIPLNSLGNIPWKLTVDPDGTLRTTSTGSTLLPDIIPYPIDVTMSIYGNTPQLLFCTTCANASVTASADLSLWCCSCSTFVLPEDTNILVVIDE